MCNSRLDFRINRRFSKRPPSLVLIAIWKKLSTQNHKHGERQSVARLQTFYCALLTVTVEQRTKLNLLASNGQSEDLNSQKQNTFSLLSLQRDLVRLFKSVIHAKAFQMNPGENLGRGYHTPQASWLRPLWNVIGVSRLVLSWMDFELAESVRGRFETCHIFDDGYCCIIHI